MAASRLAPPNQAPLRGSIATAMKPWACNQPPRLRRQALNQSRHATAENDSQKPAPSTASGLVTTSTTAASNRLCPVNAGRPQRRAQSSVTDISHARDVASEKPASAVYTVARINAASGAGR